MAAVFVCLCAVHAGAEAAGTPIFGDGPRRVCQTTAEEDSCVSCHQLQPDARLWKPVTDACDSVHRSHGVGCQDCHGGDPTKSDPVGAMRGSGRFVGAPPQIGYKSEICGRCHDQPFAQWSTSKHAGVASCTACHNHHEVRKASVDIISPFRCSSCHPYPSVNALKTYILQATTAAMSANEQVKRVTSAGMGGYTDAQAMERIFRLIDTMKHSTDQANLKTTLTRVREDSQHTAIHAHWIETGYKYRRLAIKVWIVMGIIIALVAAYYINAAVRMRRMMRR